MRQAQSPEANVMAFSRAAIDRLLETDVLAASEKIERAEWRCGIGGVEYECSNHAPRTSHPEPIGGLPPGDCKGGVKLSERTCKHKINRVAGQPVASNRVARHAPALKDFEAHAN